MDTIAKYVMAIFLVSCAGSVVAYFLGSAGPAKWLAMLPLVLSGWAFFGHLVTLDDDMPEEWSNPDGSKSFWSKSNAELLLKFGVFGLVGWWFYVVSN